MWDHLFLIPTHFCFGLSVESEVNFTAGELQFSCLQKEVH